MRKNFCPFSEYIDIIIYSGIGQKLKSYILYNCLPDILNAIMATAMISEK